MKCSKCQHNKAILIRPKNKLKMCKNCFIETFEEEIHQTIKANNLFYRGERVAVAISGGKDSTVLAYVLNLLNIRYDYGIEIYLLSVDEGIKFYRDSSLETVEQNQKDYDLPLKIVSFNEYFNYTMDDIVKIIGKKGNCTYCGVFRRQALEKGARELGVSQIVTGHNADDMAETVLMNILRGDHIRLKKSTLIKTSTQEMTLPRSKPFKYIYEKEIVMYAFYNNLKYFSTECTYSPGAYRGDVRLYIKELERIDPLMILKIIQSGEEFQEIKVGSNPGKCNRCGEITSSDICKACDFIEILKKHNRINI